MDRINFFFQVDNKAKAQYIDEKTHIMSPF
jgi:hypothetical protein